ncbi:MAG: topoisomerase IV [Ruminococcaceae bacterium]|nr:topoisomerase IV [Oscillospiraceae bacterium]
MAKKKTTKKTEEDIIPAIVQNQYITDTIEKNYMPYVMSVIVSRAIPEIDGFKPSHRKLLYTMYKMGLMTGARTKSSNVVGQTMRLNPHGDMAIYETLVRLTRGNEALLHPFIDSKGSFGKQYSRDMAFAAPRYTEVKLDTFCSEIFTGIDRNAVDMVSNYDNTTTEPTLLPTAFPNILVSPNTGIAVGLQSNICSFNLSEICDGTIALLKHPNMTTDKLMDIIIAPDFAGGANLIYDRAQMKEIYETGSGSFRMRARYTYDKQNNCIEILQIPYSTSIEIILKRIADLIKEGKIKEITDLRDEIDLNGFKLTMDVRRGTDPDALMARLFKLTTLEDTFACNFNVLVDKTPKLLGVKDILTEWIQFRIGCVKRELTFELAKKKDKLHLLRGLGKILLDIDKAIKIVRETEKESDVVPRLMEGFHIDDIQAEYIAEIKLRHLNREYIIERIKEIENLQKEIADLEDTIRDDIRIKDIIAKQLAAIKKKHGKPRKTQIIYSEDITETVEEETVENYAVYVVLTKEGYFKKITRQSLRVADEQKLKEGDEITNAEESDNTAELLFFTNQAQVYKAKVDDFENTKASALGDFIPAKLEFDENEVPVMMKALKSYDPEDHIIFLFENGKGVRVPVQAYETKNNRRKLTSAFSDASPIAAVIYEKEPMDLLLENSAGKGILIRSDLIPEKTTRTSVGVSLFNMKSDVKITSVRYGEQLEKLPTAQKLRKNKIPATGITTGVLSEQVGLDIDN